MYYIRKLSNKANLLKIKAAQDIKLLDADILKQELGTTGNTLSFWKCDDLDNTDDAIKAILLSTTGIATSQFFIINDEVVKKYGLLMDDTELGVTGYRGHENLHVNMVKLNYAKIGTILEMLKEVFQHPEYTPKLEKSKVKERILEVKKQGLLNEANMQEQLVKDVEKYCPISV